MALNLNPCLILDPHLIPFGVAPWDDTLRALDGLDYLKGSLYGRMHRVVQQVVLNRMPEQIRSERLHRVEAFIENPAAMVHDRLSEFSDLSEGEAVVAFI